MKEKLHSAKNAVGLALRIIFAVLIIAVIIANFKTLQNLDVRALLAKSASLPIQLLTILGVYAVKGLTLVVPASLVYIAVGMSLDKIWLAVLINCIGILVEISVTYLMGIILGGPFVKSKLEKTKYGAKVFSIYEKHEKSGIFIIRILGLPIDLCSLFFGAMRVRYLPYIGMSLAGILPRVILFTILGDKVYDLIPMKYMVPVGAALIAVALTIWIVRYCITSAKKEAARGIPAYTPICEKKRNVILDTDMGPDCDDAGALALLLQYCKKYDVKLLGVCNCTSNRYANGTIKAICEYYGIDEPYVGQYKGGEMLPDGLKYNKAVTKKYCKYENSACNAEDSIYFYKKLLTQAEDNSVTIITIGTLTTLAGILNEDKELFNRKVHSVVTMGGKAPKGKEFNIKCDPISAAAVLEKYRNIMVFSDHGIGEDIHSGFEEEQENNPVFDCYKLYLDRKHPPYLRSSYDLTAVQYAFEGNGEYYGLSKPLSVAVDIDGNTVFKKDKYSNRYCMIKVAEDEVIAAHLNKMLKGITEEETSSTLPVIPEAKPETNVQTPEEKE